MTCPCPVDDGLGAPLCAVEAVVTGTDPHHPEVTRMTSTRERALDTATQAIAAKLGSMGAADTASDVLDDLESAGLTVVERWTVEQPTDLEGAGRALVDIDDDPMVCAPGGQRFTDAIDRVRRALPGPIDHATVDDVVLRDHGLAELGMNHAARATTPGDDRGRELARALDDLGRLVERIDTGTTTIDVSFATRLARARLDVARYVAAPPETEVSTGSLLDAIGNAVYEAGVGRSGPDPTWHGVATAAERAARAWFARRAAPAEIEATYAIEGRDETCPSCQATVGTSLAYVLDEHTSSIEDGPGSENPPTLCGSSEVAVHHVLAASPPAQSPAETEGKAGDVPPELWWHPEHGVIMPTVADGHDYGWYLLEARTWLDERPAGAARLAATPPAPEGEAVSSFAVPPAFVGEGRERGEQEQWLDRMEAAGAFAGLGRSGSAPVWMREAAARVDAPSPAPAGRQAEGAGETGGGGA